MLKKLFLIIISLVSIQASAQFCNISGGCGALPSGFTNGIEVTATTDNSSIQATSPSDGSLRWALLKANTLTGGTYICFKIPGTGTQTIQLSATSLPNITSKIFIDGWSQAGSGNYTIILQGFFTANEGSISTYYGLNFQSGSSNSIVKGITIVNTRYSVWLAAGANDILFEGNRFGGKVNLRNFHPITTYYAYFIYSNGANNIILKGNFFGINLGTYSFISVFQVTSLNGSGWKIGGTQATDRNYFHMKHPGGYGCGNGQLQWHGTAINIDGGNNHDIIGNKVGINPIDLSDQSCALKYGIQVQNVNTVKINNNNIVLTSRGINIVNSREVEVFSNKINVSDDGLTSVISPCFTAQSNQQGDTPLMAYGSKKCSIGKEGINGNIILPLTGYHVSAFVDLVSSDSNSICNNKLGVYANNQLHSYISNNIRLLNSSYNVIGGTHGVKSNIVGNGAIIVDGSSSDYNRIQENILLYASSFTNFDAIRLINAGNNDKLKPTITGVTSAYIQGTSVPNDTIEVFRSNNVGVGTVEYFGTVVTDGSGFWNLPRFSWRNVNYTLQLTDLFVATATDGQRNTSQLSTPKHYCAPAIIDIPPIICPDKNLVNMTGYPAGGIFTSPYVVSNSQFNAQQAGPGTFSVSYSVTQQGCTTVTATAETYVMPRTKLMDRVLDVSAITLSDAWPVYNTQENILSSSQLTNLNARDDYYKGVKGIWKTESAYTYVYNRKQSSNINLQTDGIVNNLPMFVWKTDAMDACFPGWRKTITTTKYDPHSNGRENKDIVSISSSVLLGYAPRLVIASAQNARENEIAFQSFEEYTTPGLNPQKCANSNLSLYTTAPGAADLTDQYFRQYEIVEAYGTRLTLAMPYITAVELLGKSVKVYGAMLTDINVKNISGSYSVVSVDPHASPSKAVITLANTFTVTGNWKGKLSYAKDFTSGALPHYSIDQTASVSSDYAHTGKRSFKINNGMVKTEQIRLALEPGKKYGISGWVRTSNSNDSLSYVSTTGVKRGIGMTFLGMDGILPSAIPIIEPSGPLVEGWQRIEGVVTVPEDSIRPVLVLSAASSTTYFDDIRIYPFESSFVTYVYDPIKIRQVAKLDDNNYATYYEYDESGGLYQILIETEKGIQSVKEGMTHIREK